MMDEMIVIKRNPAGEETWRYPGKIIERGVDWIRIEAYFNRDDLPFHGIVLGRGDRFLETFYSDRWYNVFEIHARETDEFKGWYCNVTCPAEIDDHTISYIDLALDLLVFPDRSQLVLDEDEYYALHLEPNTAEKASTALRELQSLFARPV
jgi:predicted RNA-binding protein associated with RNAse of E/G family